MTDRGFSEQEAAWMRQAIRLARNGEGRVAPNPPVGCVLVKDGVAVGRGWHNRLGDLHAEAAALRDAGESARGATAYVTLSPCTTHGRQPPCADALVRAGVAEVIVAADDPNPRNALGAEVLLRAGIPARSGLLREEAEYLARGFFKMMRKGLPFLTLKYAMTLDGKIATPNGDSRWVSGPESRELVQDMRSRCDAILIGSGTALADNPLLTVREPTLSRRGGPDVHPQPLRVVVDSQCRLPPDAAMLNPAAGPGGKALVACRADAPAERIARLEKAGAEVLIFPPGADGRVLLPDLLERLGRRGVNTILGECGGELAAGLLAAGLADEVAAFIAPKIAGGGNAPGPVGGPGVSRMAEALALRVRECRRAGDDMVLWAVPAP